jgi:glycosyltransferase involved in cell wall biosynthesis
VVFVHTNREHLIAAIACWLGGRARIVRRVPAGETLAMKRSGRVAAWLVPTCFLFTNEPDARAARLPKRRASSIVVPLGIDLDHLHQALDGNAPVIAPTRAAEEYIVCLHDASSRSRAATAIRTLAMLAPRHPALHLVIIGETSYDDDLRMQAAAKRVLHLVTFLGERDDALHIMRDARLGWVVADTDSAAFGILDFMALGVPVLAAENTLAERYVLSDITGVLLPPDDAYLTAATVAGLLVNEQQREIMGEAASARVAREFPESAMIDGFERAAVQIAPRHR